MKKDFRSLILTLAIASALTVPALASPAQSDQGAQPAASAAQPTTAAMPVKEGKQKVEGIITERDGDRVVLRRGAAGQVVVRLSKSTEILEKKSNPFRHARKFGESDLLRGLRLEVEGRPNGSGEIVADKVRFTNDSRDVAEVVDTRSVPMENRLSSTETRMTDAEQNQKHLSGQITEVGGIANAAKTGAANAQQTADRAVDGVAVNGQKIVAVNDRVTSIDDYQVAKTATVLFKAGSTVLSREAKEELTALVDQAKQASGYVIEVAGFASSDGNAALNERLSDMRANAVTHYLALQDVPQRRIVNPLGYGVTHPVADNTTHKGRIENRRVEVRLLVSRGLTAGAATAQNAPASAPQTASSNDAGAPPAKNSR